tara:strand:- start:1123 stop:2064 length:942 start_codon:yes stop_codon:yes gene_type:complete
MPTKKLKIIKLVLNYAYSNRGEHLFYCPFCEHHKPKLSVNVEKNVFKCWVCDTRGRDNYYLVKRFGNFNQQQEWLKITNQTDIRDFEVMFSGSYREEKVEQIIELPEEYKPLFSVSEYLYSQKPINYLKSRGISHKQIFNWKIGYCSEGEYKDRVIIPSFNEDGDINYFIARSYIGDWMRYKNPPASRDIVFNDLNIDWEEDIILVEGVFDAFKEPNMIPILGSTLRENSELFQKIVNNKCNVFIALDLDAREKEKNIILKFMDYGVPVYKIDTKGYKDISEMPNRVYFDRKEKAIPINRDNFFEYEFSHSVF